MTRLAQKGMATSQFDGDVRRADQVNEWIASVRPTHLYHFAAIVPLEIVDRRPIDAIETNVLGTGHVLAAIAKFSPECWTFMASTSHVYKPSPYPLKESDELSPTSLYGETKLAAERLAELYLQRTNLKVCIGRIFSFYHETQRKPFLYPTIRDRIAKHEVNSVFELRGGHDVRDFSNAEDIIGSILALTDAEYSGFVNIGSGSATEIQKFVRGLSDDTIRIRVVQDRPPTHLVADITQLRRILAH